MDDFWACELFVPGVPRPQGSKRHVGKGVLIEQTESVYGWRNDVALLAATCAPKEPWTGAVAVRMRFCFTRPKSRIAPKKDPLRYVWMSSGYDLDKLERAVLDALTGVWFVDDRQVCNMASTKEYVTSSRGDPLPLKPGLYVAARAMDARGNDGR
jgi:crossover junction endodeoxyribonuclease RusA